MNGVFVYILYSATLEKHYVGLSKHPRQRLKQHQRGQTTWTSRATDWTSVYQQQLPDVRSARNLEKRIKALGAARFLLSALPNPVFDGTGLNACPVSNGIAGSIPVSRSKTRFNTINRATTPPLA